MQQKILLAIVGPTGIGKTAAAVALAKDHSFEIISADSRQVYKGMDIATGKEVDLGEWQTLNGRRTLVVGKVFIHGLDVVEPNQPFSVADWYRLASTLITEITQRDHQPLIVGGTGFYLDALAGRIKSLQLPPDPILRSELASFSVAELQNRLGVLNSAKLLSMNDSDLHNPARLIRGIEIAIGAEQSETIVSGQLHSYDLSLIGLTLPRSQLLQRVDRRIDEMIEQGLVEEARRLLERYGSDIPSMSGIGYREVGHYLLGKINLTEAVRLIKIRTHQYVKRQYTWFNHRPVKWVDASESGWMDRLSELVNGD